MKKINFIVILLTFVVSLTFFMYIDVLSEFIERGDVYIGATKVTNLDVLGIFLATLVWAILPSWVLAYIYRLIQNSKYWLGLIAVIYFIVWIGISFLLMNEYIMLYGNTWLSSEILFHVMHQNHFLLVYVLSFMPLAVLAIFNVRKNHETH